MWHMWQKMQSIWHQTVEKGNYIVSWDEIQGFHITVPLCKKFRCLTENLLVVRVEINHTFQIHKFLFFYVHVSFLSLLATNPWGDELTTQLELMSMRHATLFHWVIATQNVNGHFICCLNPKRRSNFECMKLSHRKHAQALSQLHFVCISAQQLSWWKYEQNLVICSLSSQLLQCAHHRKIFSRWVELWCWNCWNTCHNWEQTRCFNWKNCVVKPLCCLSPMKYGICNKMQQGRNAKMFKTSEQPLH